MSSNAQRRGPLLLRVTATSAGVRVRGLGELSLDPAEARDLAARLLAAADTSEHAAAPGPPEDPGPLMLPAVGCTVDVAPVAGGGVVLRATHAVGQGRWLSAPHELDGCRFPTAQAACSAARAAGLLADHDPSRTQEENR